MLIIFGFDSSFSLTEGNEFLKNICHENQLKMGGKIGVFPASGGLGSSSVNHLGQLYSASELVLIARSPERLSRFKEAGATVRQADYDSPETLEHAFDGVDTLLLISYASFEIEHRIQVGE